MGETTGAMQELEQMIAAFRLTDTEGLSFEPHKPFSDCQKCDGSGWIHYKDELGRSYGDPCVCRIRSQEIQRIKASGLENALKDCRFDNFVRDTPLAKGMAEMAERYLAEIAGNDNPPWLMIGGAVGCGKTHICTAVCGRLIEMGMRVRYMEWIPASRKIKAMVGEEEADELIDRYANVQVLYIDDLFKNQRREETLLKPTDADVRIAFEIINRRYIARKPTIITSEWYIAELVDVDEAVFSRVFQKTGSGKYALTIKRDKEKNRRLKNGGGML